MWNLSVNPSDIPVFVIWIKWFLPSISIVDISLTIFEYMNLNRLYLKRTHQTSIVIISLMIMCCINRCVWWGVVYGMVFNVTYNNMSVISWRSILFGGGNRSTRINHRPVASYWQSVLHNVVSSNNTSPWTGFELRNQIYNSRFWV